MQRIHVKDLSFLSSDALKLFQEPSQLKNEMELKLEHKELEKHHYEVVLDVTVKTTKKEEEELKNLLVTYCPEMLYPYTRHIVTELSIMGGLPPVILASINFHMLHKQQQDFEKKGNKDV